MKASVTMSQALQPEQLLVLQSASCRLHAVRIGVYFAMTAQHQRLAQSSTPQASTSQRKWQT